VILYPNPSNVEVKIKLYTEVSKPFDIEIIDLQGNSLHKFNFSANNSGQNLVNIPTELLRNGTYIVRVIDKEGNRISKKVVIQK
jgi:hypothetical protein